MACIDHTVPLPTHHSPHGLMPYLVFSASRSIARMHGQVAPQKHDSSQFWPAAAATSPAAQQKQHVTYRQPGLQTK